jgi:hypothetical protein
MSTTAINGSNQLPAHTCADPIEAAAWASLMISDAQCTTAKERIQTTQVEREHDMVKARKALEEARRQEAEKSFWEEVASTAQTVGTVAAAVAAVAATGGAATPVVALAIAGAGLSLTSEAMRREYISGGDQKLFSIGDYDFTLGDGFALAGMAAGGVAGGFAVVGEGGTSAFARTTGVVTHAVRAGAAGTQAYATYRSGHAGAEAVDSYADARQHTLRAHRLDSKVRDQVDAIQTATETRSRALEAVASMLETRKATMNAAIGSRA